MNDDRLTRTDRIASATDHEYIARSAGDKRLLVGVTHDGVPAAVADRLTRLAANLPDGVRTVATETGPANDRLGTLTVAVDTDVTDLERVAERLNAHDAVAYVEADHIVTPAGLRRRDLLAGLAGAVAGTTVAGADCLTGDDGDACLSPLPYPELKPESEYGVRFPEQHAPQQVDAPKAWDRLSGRCGDDTPVIAVIDTGVAKHPHLVDNRLSDGYDVVNDSDDATPGDPLNHLHGTHVAGIAAGNVGTDSQTYPISNADILPVKVFGETVGTTAKAVADGIQYAAAYGADIANLSLGAPFPNQTIKRAVRFAVERGTLPVAAAGNDGRQGVSYPAGFGDVLAVGAVGPDGTVAEFSNYGQGVNIVAPGVNILSSIPEKFLSELPVAHPYYRLDGTSMATPAAAGVAALGLQATPDLSVFELKNYIEATARTLPDTPVIKQGAGVADAGALTRTV